MKKFIFLFLISLSSFSYSYINIYPIKFEKDITKGASEEFVLYNRSNKTRRYRVYVEDIEGKKSMGEWVELYPKSLTLKSLEEKSVKIYIEVPDDKENGEYETNLVFKEILLPTPELSQKERGKKTNVLTMVKLRLKGKIKR